MVPFMTVKNVMTIVTAGIKYVFLLIFNYLGLIFTYLNFRSGRDFTQLNVGHAQHSNKIQSDAFFCKQPARKIQPCGNEPYDVLGMLNIVQIVKGKYRCDIS